MSEDRESFMARAEDVLRGERSSLPRVVKRLWNSEADHDFFSRLVKVHWVSGLTGLPAVLSGGAGGREISVGLYLPGDEMVPSYGYGSRSRSWGDLGVGVGVRLRGRVVLASNDMDSLRTGYDAGSRVKRGDPEAQDLESLRHYVLDADSFRRTSGSREGRSNEGLLAHWSPVSIVLGGEASRNRGLARDLVNAALGDEAVSDFFVLALKAGRSPVVGPSGEPIELLELDASGRLRPSDPDWKALEVDMDALRRG